MITIDRERCTGCGTCPRVCPHGVLALDGGTAVLAHEDRCIECGACELNCLEEAVTVTRGVGCLVAIIREELLGIAAPGTGCDCGC
jgi:NAD-dependent dihydropyrimidine dehydrogenase PreA subunit